MLTGRRLEQCLTFGQCEGGTVADLQNQFRADAASYLDVTAKASRGKLSRAPEALVAWLDRDIESITRNSLNDIETVVIDAKSLFNGIRYSLCAHMPCAA